ncbi:MAG TPA: STT3 domain-containing protein [Candidatus Dormibacteraeota bacterium]|nr:STT3 domain-containing protein [Candidatus Dormibacteraeota bacterium]
MSATGRALRRAKGFLVKYINRETLADRVDSIRKTASGVSRGAVLEYIALSLIVIIALAVRLMPIRWGYYLNEFDPYLQWRMIQYTVDHGFLAWFQWHDTMSWYPYGADMPTWNLYGEAFVVAAIVMFLRDLGVAASPFNAAMIFPVVAGTLTVLVAYFLGKDFWGKGAGLLTALFLALNPSSIGRTQLGFLRHEPLGILLMLLMFLFFRRSTVPKSSTRSTIVYSSLAGFALFYLAAEWAGSLFPLDLIPLYVVVLVLVGRYSKKLFLSYSISMGIFLVFTPFLVPKLGFSDLTDITWLAVIAGEVVLLAREASSYLENTRARFYTLVGAVAATAAVVVVLSYFNIVSLPYGKFFAVINPFVRGNVPIIASVAEHQPATWGSFFYEFGAITFLILFGIVFVIQRGRNEDIFLVLWGITAVYFAASFVRLTLLLAPAFCILGAIGTVELGKPAVDIVREAVIYPKRKTRVISRIGREFGLAIFLILLIAIIPTFWTAVRGSYQPATIVTSSIPTAPSAGNELKYQDWLEALSWMRLNTPPSSVVFAWWDYGYWITALGNRTTIADNGTQNSTQIGMIAQTFLDNITMAIPNLQRYNVSYVAIFITPSGGSSGGWQGFGEDGKWYWMARIGNQTAWNKYQILFLETNTNAQTGQSDYVREIVNATSKKVISNDTITTSAQLNADSMLGYMMTITTSNTQTTPSPYLTQAFASTNKFVFLFRVNYIKSTRLTMRPIPPKINYGQKVLLAGNMTDPSGKPLQTTPIQLYLESSVDSGQTWQDITLATTSPYGAYNYTWTPNAGNYLVRAHYLSTSSTYAETFSTPLHLLVTKSNSTITLSTSPASFSTGQNVTIAVTMSPLVAGANVTVSYTSDNKTFTPIKTVAMTSETMSFTWKADVSGSYMIVAAWQGDVNYNPAAASITVHA